MLRRSGRLMRVGAVVATALATTGCTGSDGAGSDSQPEATDGTAAAATAAAANTPPTTGGTAAPEALRFTAPLVGGGTIDAAAYAGQPVLFWFWAPY